MNRELEAWKIKQEKKFKKPDGKFYPPPVRHMLAFYGKSDGICEKCIHLRGVHVPNVKVKVVLRCGKFNLTKGTWQKDYPACGLYEEKQNEK